MIYAEDLTILDIEFWKFLSDYGLDSIIYSGIKWAMIGLVSGLLVGIASFGIIRSLKGYAMSTYKGKWPLVLTFIFVLSLSTIAGGYFGFVEGLWRGAQVAMQKDKFRSDISSISGELGSLTIACVYCVEIRNEDGKIVITNEKEIRERVDSFEKGMWEIDVERLNDRLQITTEKLAEPLIQIVHAEAIRTWPSLSTGIPNRFLRWLLTTMGRALAEKKIEKDLDNLGVLPYFRNVIRGIKAQAALAGDVNAISHKELSAYVAEDQILTFMQQHIRKLIKGHQSLALYIFLFSLILPVLIIKITERVRLRRAERKD